MSAALSDRQRAMLRGVERQQTPALLVGTLLVATSLAYGIWAVRAFDPRGDPFVERGFDAALTGPVLRVYERFHAHLARTRATAETSREGQLAHWLARSLTFHAGLLVLAVRLILGTLAGMLGLATWTVVVERRRLLRIIGQLRAAPPEPAPIGGSPG